MRPEILTSLRILFSLFLRRQPPPASGSPSVATYYPAPALFHTPFWCKTPTYLNASAQEGNVRRKVRRNRNCTYMNVESWPEWSKLLDSEKKPFKQKMTTEKVEYGKKRVRM
ncbi:hypothetical protein E1A91_D02G113000v1 [Gossypium mustelinum]|uniref:Uncharacterized protein n=1 Tax=Gossypium mustelinum TaxID=34275 RepID=A0A5D2VUI4_GOSMU|nr:hypothetical protein E1A91_D02G113000v1 [Gossypium mustelinum]